MNALLPFHAWMQQLQAEMKTTLTAFLPAVTTIPTHLHQAMHYAVLNGGKRIRPLLVYAAGALFEAPEQILARAAAAVEMIHVYSLVHDDMPCMDNDTLRRGKPTVHVQYDEATALLVGDALQSQAFAVLSATMDADFTTQQLTMLNILAQAIGPAGMCGGQAIDLISVGQHLSLEQLQHMHQLKTGALLRTAVLLGAYSGQLLSSTELEALTSYANAIGLSFQIVDDILDNTMDSATLGKTAGKDAKHQKPTYMSILGFEQSQALVEQLRHDAHDALQPFQGQAQRLHELADFIVDRKI